MRPQRHWARIGMPLVAVAALTGAVLASPAYAEETPSPTPSDSASPAPSNSPTVRPEPTNPGPRPVAADLAVRIATDKVAVGSQGKVMRVDIANYGPDTAKDVVLTLDLSGLNDQVQVQPHGDPACKSEGKVITCSYPEIRDGATKVTAFKIKPVDGAKPGSAGTVKAGIEAKSQRDPQSGNDTDAAEIKIVDSAVDIVAAAEDVGPVQPGKSAVLHWAFGNQGDTSAKGISMKLALPAYAKFTDSYKECTYSKDRREMVCQFPDAVMAPGQVLMWNDPGVKPVYVKVAADAPGPISLGHGQFVASAHGELEPQPVAGSGSSVMAAEAPQSRNRAQDVDGDDNSAVFAVLTKKNPADLAVSASKASGAVGDTVMVRVSVTNHGPADANGFEAKIGLPTGTKLVQVPGACEKKDRVLLCRAGDFLDKGETAKQDLKLKITSSSLEKGWAKVATNKIPDREPGNNKTAITVAYGSGGSGGGLPVTGVSLTAAIGGGAAAVLLGATLFLLARRRRSAQEA